MKQRGKRGENRAGSKSLRRHPPSREPRRVVLIVCEAEKTEPEYLHALRHAHRLNRQQVRIVSGRRAGSSPHRTVRFARRECQSALQRGLKFDTVWCVFDDDGRPNAADVLQDARNAGFKVAYSNPCFELWYVLHFEDHTRSVDSTTIIRRLRKFIPNYSKSEYPEKALDPGRLDAIRRAEELREYHRRNGNLEIHNPSTTADKLVCFLDRLGRADSQDDSISDG